MEFITPLLTFIVGLIAGFVGAIAGGGGLLSIPFLILIGLPPQVAIATNKLGSIGMGTSAVYKFWKEKKVVWQYVPLLSILGLLGAYIGANLLLEVNNEILSKIVAIILIALLPTIFINKNLGLETKETKKWQKAVGFIIYFFLMILGGFFGGGIGIIAIFTLVSFFGLPFINANATDVVPWFLMSLVSLFIFALNGVIDYTTGIALLVGMLIGGYLGAHTAIRKGNAWVRGVFVVMVVASVIKLLFF